jgi:hypothetical protein
MNCDELATTLQDRLLHQRTQQWLQEACQHAAHCPSCARLLALHRLETALAKLPGSGPSAAFVSAVMIRIAQPEPATVLASPCLSWAALKYPAMFAGAMMLIAAYLLPTAGSAWSSNLWPSIGPIRLPGISAYLAYHPWWALLLASIAAWLIVWGLIVPEREAQLQRRSAARPRCRHDPKPPLLMR